MPSVSDIQHKLKAFDTFARHTEHTDALKRKWHTLFRTNLSDLSAKSFVAHYREMRSKHTRGKHGKKSRRMQRGGVAPLDYTLTPGANVAVYGRFPVEVDTDAGSIKDLDVYFQNALTFGCGKEAGLWPQVPATMGSNQVGGRRRRNTRGNKRSRKNKNTMRRGRRGRRGQRGGDIFDDIGGFFGNSYTNATGASLPTLDPISRPFFASVYPNPLQTAYNTWTGATPDNYPASHEPEKRTWDYQSNGTSRAFDASQITSINKDFNQMTNPHIYAMPPIVSSSSSSGASDGSGSGSGASHGSGSGSGASPHGSGSGASHGSGSGRTH
jgi:hypothetical protein